jgi:leader peptidase (prepilin peptidase)/N-methyltransferase
MVNAPLLTIDLNFLYLHHFWNYFFVALFGLIFGSFATVLTVRIKEGKSIVRPGSACPQCGYVLKIYDNIPVLSYLFLRGKCRGCGNKISPLYPAIEMISALLFLGVFQVSHGGFLLLSLFAFATLSLPLAIIDLQVRRLPNSLTLAGSVIGFICSVAQSVSSKNIHFLIHGISYGFFAALFFLMLNLISRGGMGIGDVKLAGMAGLLLFACPGNVMIFGLFAAFFLGALWGIVLMIFAGAKRKTAIPFGPFILLGLWMAVLLQNTSLLNYQLIK